MLDIAGSVSAPRSSARFAEGSESGPNFLREELRLFPRGKMTALVELVVVNELGIGALGPASRRLIELIGKGADGDRNRNVLGCKERKLAFPIQARRRYRRVRQPIQRRVVEDVIPRQALG